MTLASLPVARTLLFVPGDQPARLPKACAAGAGIVVIDLEDAVPPARKDEAREHVRHWLDGLSAGGARPPLALRTNGVGTPWFDADARLAGHPAIAALVLPKAEDPATLGVLARSLPGKDIVPLVETAAGMAHIAELAAVPGVLRLAFGSIDFQAELDIEADAEERELAPYRAQLVLVSRLAGLQPPVDGITTELNDVERIAQHAQRSRRLGFGGMFCIHPRQIDPVDRSFSPTPAQLEWAQRVLAADAASGGAPVAVDGKMVDKPVVLKAQALLRAGAR